MENLCALVLAAGEGKRMKSNSPKVLSKVLFKPMIKWVTDAVKGANIDNICVVAGYKHEEVEEYLKNIEYSCNTVLQLERKGTAHAVMQAEEFLRKHSGSDVLILGGDSPFIDSQAIIDSYKLHKDQGNAVTVISSKIDNPFGYGRIVRDDKTGEVTAIVEQKDADEQTKKIDEVNSGAYWFNIDALLSVLHSITNDTAQGEYYLPDAIKLLLKNKFKVNAFKSKTQELILGANDCMQLANLNNIARKQIIENLMLEGVNIPCDDGIIIGTDVKIENNTCILPGTIIYGNSHIGSGCVIGPNTQIINSTVADNVTLNSVYCLNSEIDNGESIKPFSVISK